MKTFEQWHKSQYSYINEEPFGECGQRRFAWTACDQQWREELGKDRGVKSYQDWFLSERDVLYSRDAESAWKACESLWRHKCLNIEQASSMKIAILERQIEELKKDLSLCLDRMECAEWEKDIKETRQRHKLDEVKA